MAVNLPLSRFAPIGLALARQWAWPRADSATRRRLTHVLVLAMAIGVVSAASFSPAGGTSRSFTGGVDQAPGAAGATAAIVAPVLPITRSSAPPQTMELALPESPVEVAPAAPLAAKPAPDLKSYTVEAGDNPFDLSNSFDISDETLLAANGLAADTVLQIGQKLLIPPTSGVVVSTQPGDTLRGIADQWKLDALILAKVNKLDPDAKSLLPGEALVLPGAQPPVQIWPLDSDQPDQKAAAPSETKLAPQVQQPKLLASPRPVAREVPQPAPNTHLAIPRTSANNFPYGQCTWFAAQNRPDIGSRVLGNAASWLYSARAAGLATGSQPQVGAVVVYQPGAQGAAWTGHVAVVTSVAGNGVNFTIREMNYAGWAVVSTRASWTGPGVSFIY